MVFGLHSGVKPPQLGAHNQDPNYPSPYQSGPSSNDYISDPNHPDYDPAIDPNLQLRTVRTAAASIAESHRSEMRLDERRKQKRKQSGKSGGSILGKLGRGRSMLNRNQSSRKGYGSANAGLTDLVKDEFGRKQGGGLGPSGAGANGDGIGVPFDSAQQFQTPLDPTSQSKERAEEEARREDEYRNSINYDHSDDEEQEEMDEKLQQNNPALQSQTLKKGKKKKVAKRRNIYLNMPLLPNEVNSRGEPLATYPRNKVRTSKYTVFTFLPRFLFEQFRRIANIYFLGLVILQVFPTFGATVPQIAMLPLVSILTITAIKDSIEDYRRHVLDNQVNNSAVTRLGNWRNVNLPRDNRGWFTRLFTSKPSSPKVSKGVRKLREKEDAIGMRAVSKSSGNKIGSGSGAGGPAPGAFQSGQDLSRQRTTGSVSSVNNLETIVSESDRDLGSVYGTPNSIRGGGGGGENPLNNASFTASQSMNSVSGGGIGDRSSNGDGVVDYMRNTPGTARWERTLWKKLEVGDIVLLHEDDQVPADIVVLNSSDPDGNAFIETKNLDGETNLKVRKSLKATTGIQSEEDIEHARFIIDSEPPHANLYSYNGLLKYTSSKGLASDSYEDHQDEFGSGKPIPPHSSASAANDLQNRKVEPITINELLLRGCAIRNTDWVLGIVIFTGEDTKIMLNSGETPSKRSKIEKETNFNVLMNFFMLLAMCVICAVVGGLWYNQTDTSRAVYEPNVANSDSNILNALIILGSCLVVFQNIVPISLYISIEIVKTIQAFFIYQDIDMYYAPLDYPCVPKTWNISDDLGQIEYIFSDKTGTLTQNVMEFKKCSINGISYGEGITEAMVGAMKREGKDTSNLDPDAEAEKLNEAKRRMIQTMTRSYKNRYLREDQLTLISPSMSEELASGAGSEQRRNIVAFFRALALCHTALTDRPEADDPFVIEYKAQSPDEAALVSAARDVGAVFLNKNNHTIDIEVMGQPERYTPLKVLEFNSTRKRMSTIVREPDGKILMICKGADSVIYQRLTSNHDERMKEVTQKDLENFANAGLRTLCIAYRYLQEGEYLEWAKKFDEASASLTDRDENIDAACEEIEYDLTLLGATALEDKLQVGVPEAIEMLHSAGIKLWILTGDKLQTAIEIGFSCNLLSSEMEIMIISADHEQGTRAQIEAACNKIASAGRPVVIEPENRKKAGKKRAHKLKVEPTEEAPSGGFAVVIDGETLRYALDPGLKPLFLALTTQCETVVCCRVSPAQKALTVKLVKEGKDAMTLAIGDGANDVAMIQEAHCGVGIAGLEGAQASMSADYAIGQFRFLTKLLLVHGHWSYVRIADMHKVFFYKNIIWTFSMFWFQIFCNFNATYLYDYSYVLLFNLVFTSLPVIILGALDQDVNPKAIMAHPETYRRGIAGLEYTRPLFWSAVIDAIYQSAVCFFVPYVIWSLFPTVSADGLDMGSIWLFGTTVGACAVISANLYCGLSMRYWTWIFWIIEFASIVSYFVWSLVYSAFNGLYTDVAFWLYSTVVFWATVVLVVILCLLPRFFAKSWRIAFAPTEVDIVREAWVKGDLKNRLGLRGEKGSSSLYQDHENDGGLFQAAKRSTDQNQRERNRDDNVSETSADPLPVDSYEEDFARRARVDQVTDEAWARLQPEASGNRASRGNELASRLSYYAPEDISSNPASPTPYAQQQHSYPRAPPTPGSRRSSLQGGRIYEGDLPAIAIQRASHDTSRNAPYQPYGGAADSRTALQNAASTDSFNAEFEKAFGPDSNDGVYQNSYSSPSPRVISVETAKSSSPSAANASNDEETSPIGARFHDRFKLNSPPRASHKNYSEDVLDSFEPTPRQQDFGDVQSMGLGPIKNPHNRDASGMSDYSYHTADHSAAASEAGNENSQWR